MLDTVIVKSKSVKAKKKTCKYTPYSSQHTLVETEEMIKEGREEEG